MATQQSGSAYPIRRDIEGLRAVAVLAVILNHMRPSRLPGGFVGVDIFFVISGYLIGMHLLQDIEAGRFSFLRFYGRRARRLLPALVVMLAVVWAIGWLILSGPEFVDLGKHIVATSLFANNILLWSQSGYFDAPAASKPLLHLWSLGVEEQFYLVVPLLLWLNRTAHRGSVGWVLRLSVVSLLCTVLYPVPSFYLLDTRFWELGVGVAIGYLSLYGMHSADGPMPVKGFRPWEVAALAIISAVAIVLSYSTRESPWLPASVLASGGLGVLLVLAIAAPALSTLDWNAARWRSLVALFQARQQRIRQIASLSGVALIGVSLAAIDSSGWPGPQTVFPVLGTALVIVGGPSTLANRLLGTAPFVFVGGISYPLYLWHWPAMVFYRTFGFDADSVAVAIPLAGAAALAWLTKKYVEEPLRFGRWGPWSFTVPRVRLIASGLMLVGCVGAVTIATDGFPMRFPPSLRAIADWSAPWPDVDWRRDRCFFQRGSHREFSPECTPPKRTGVPYVLLWGDSHAGHLYPGLISLRDRATFDLAQWTSSACPPVRQKLIGEDSSCEGRRETALNDLPRISPDTVLMAAAWEMYLASGTSETSLLAAVNEEVLSLQALGVRRVVIFGPVPSWETSSDIFMYMLRHRLTAIPERLGRVSPAVRHLDDVMAVQAAAEHVEYVSVIDRFCNDHGCLVVGDRHASRPDLLYRDQDHLTPSGSRLLVEGSARHVLGAQ